MMPPLCHKGTQNLDQNCQFFSISPLPRLILATAMTNTIHKPNNFNIAVLDSSHKLHGFYTSVKTKNQDLVARDRLPLISFTLK